MPRNVEFDFKFDPWGKKEKYAAITDQMTKAYVWYHENLKPTQDILASAAHTKVGSTVGQVPVLEVVLELTGDELEFVKTALSNEFNRRF